MEVVNGPLKSWDDIEKDKELIEALEKAFLLSIPYLTPIDLVSIVLEIKNVRNKKK